MAMPALRDSVVHCLVDDEHIERRHFAVVVLVSAAGKIGGKRKLA